MEKVLGIAKRAHKLAVTAILLALIAWLGPIEWRLFDSRADQCSRPSKAYNGQTSFTAGTPSVGDWNGDSDTLYGCYNAHDLDTTSVHGITDTSAIVTLTGTQSLSNKTNVAQVFSGTATGDTNVVLEDLANVFTAVNTFSANLSLTGTNPILNLIANTGSSDESMGLIQFQLSGSGVLATINYDATNDEIEINGADLVVAGDVTSTGNFISSKACDSGFTRLHGNFCRKNGDATDQSWTDTVACTGRTTGYSLSADAKMVMLEVQWVALASGSTSQIKNDVEFFLDNTCASVNAWLRDYYGVREWASGVTAGIEVGWKTSVYVVPLIETDTFYAKQLNAGGNGNATIASFEVLGYWDN